LPVQQNDKAFGNLDAYRSIFFEEAREHLAAIEAHLLRLDPASAGTPWTSELNAIFRAVHSVKGSAAMLGFDDMAALTHLQENLLDILRKDERPLLEGDIEAMLRAGDVVGALAMRHSGKIGQAPDTSEVEQLLREQIAVPRRGSTAGRSGPVTRRFQVRLGPLATPIEDAQLAIMLEGLQSMGRIDHAQLDNRPGGSVGFQVELEGTRMDLENVLALLVEPDLIAIEQVDPPATEAVAGVADVPAVQPDVADELFVSPEALKRNREAGTGAAAPAALPQDELFVTPEAIKAARRTAPPAPSAAVASAPTAVRAVDDHAIPTAADASYIRVATEKIDLLVNLVGELVITEAMLARSAGIEAGASGTGLADLARHTRNLQDAVLAIRMLPISNVFSRYPRMVHELAARLGKKVDITFDGEGTELDRGLIERITDPLAHLVRNAVDHGLESPQERTDAGKPPAGSLRLHATQRGGSVVIEVSDDGRGLDRERILAKAAQLGIAVPQDAPDEQVWELIFTPGFSTASQVTDVSGRGVGMDVVRRNIHSMGGMVHLASARGWGTTVTVSVPLTLAIVEAMTVAVGDATYVLPMSSVMESMSIDAGAVRALPGGGETLCLRDDYLPVLRMDSLFPPQVAGPAPGGIAVIVEADGNRVALLVDELVGQQQVVVKSLEANFRRVPGLSGATVMSDGRVSFILDVNHLVRLCAPREASLSSL
jgi:two-component system, chemotaxis family, sensor kinase CheA